MIARFSHDLTEPILFRRPETLHRSAPRPKTAVQNLQLWNLPDLIVPARPSLIQLSFALISEEFYGYLRGCDRTL